MLQAAAAVAAAAGRLLHRAQPTLRVSELADEVAGEAGSQQQPAAVQGAIGREMSNE